MADIPIRTTASSAEEHLDDHRKLHALHNGVVRGPYSLNFANADAGVNLFTPQVGDLITGLWVEVTQGWDVEGEQVGIGVAATTDDDLAMKFPTPTMVPAARVTFPRGQGVGIPLGGEVIRILTEAPLIARTVIGGNTTGGLNLWLSTIPASAAAQ